MNKIGLYEYIRLSLQVMEEIGIDNERFWVLCALIRTTKPHHYTIEQLTSIQDELKGMS